MLIDPGGAVVAVISARERVGLRRRRGSWASVRGALTSGL